MLNKNFCCEYCNQFFSRKFCLVRHLENRCKLKHKLNKIEETSDVKIQQNTKINLILKQNEELKNEINKLKNIIKKRQNN